MEVGTISHRTGESMYTMEVLDDSQLNLQHRKYSSSGEHNCVYFSINIFMLPIYRQIWLDAMSSIVKFIYLQNTKDDTKFIQQKFTT